MATTTASIAVLITSTFLQVGKHQQWEPYKTLAECEMRVVQFRNESFFHRGFCRVVPEDIKTTYGGWK